VEQCGLVLPALTLTGNLTVTTGGNISEGGVLTVAGVATLPLGGGVHDAEHLGE